MSESELNIEVPWDIMDTTNGFSLDMGGSLLKLVYLSKEDWVEPLNRKKESKAVLRMVKFPSTDLDKALAFLHTNCHFMDGGKACHVTGIGSSHNNSLLESQLNVKVTVLSEGDCFVHSLVYLLKHHPQSEICHAIYQPAFDDSRKELRKFKTMLEKMKQNSPVELPETSEGFKDEQLLFPQEEYSYSDNTFSKDGIDRFPCIMVMYGSGGMIFKVHQDGQFDFLHHTPRCGRMFLGLGRLLTGAKTYAELMSLCEQGDSSKVNTSADELSKTIERSPKEAGKETAEREASGKSEIDVERQGDDMLGLHEAEAEEHVVFTFGKAVDQNPDAFAKEDLARCLLKMMVMEIVQLTVIAAKNEGVKHCFFAGGFFNHPLARQIATREFLRKDNTLTCFTKQQTDMKQIHFMRHGSHMGALGALLNHKQQFIKTTDT